MQRKHLKAFYPIIEELNYLMVPYKYTIAKQLEITINLNIFLKTFHRIVWRFIFS